MAFIIVALVIDHDKASPSFEQDHDRGGGDCGTRTSFSSSIGTTIVGPYGTSSFSGTMIGGHTAALECPLPLTGP
jgi:hypothetical protein